MSMWNTVCSVHKEAEMAKSRPWVARRFQTFKFKGREPRGLLWKKSVYKEWFEYAKLAEKLPKEFGDVHSFKNFEEWWRDPKYGFELFCEPPEAPPIEVLEHGVFQEDKAKVFVALNLEQSADKIVHQIKNLLKKHQKKIPEYKPQARFQPSKEPKRIMLEKITRYRLSLSLFEEGWTRREIRAELMKKKLYGIRNTAGDPVEPDLRVLTRDISNARQIVKRVEKGIFP